MVKKITKLIVVDADGEIITCANGLVSSDNRELVRIVKREALIGTPVQLVSPFGSYVTATLDPTDLVGLTAALFSARPGRTRLLEAPAEVWDFIEEELDENEEPDSYAPVSDEDLETVLNQLENSRPVVEENEGDK